MSNDEGTALWDDSALVNAFEDAMYKYKKMHSIDAEKKNIKKGKEEYVPSMEGEKVGTDESGNTRDLTGQTSRDVTDLNGGDSTSGATMAAVGLSVSSSRDGEEADDIPQVQENLHEGSHIQEPHTDAANKPHIQETYGGYTNSQGVDEYNQLLYQYYELEEQRQKVLQQLNQVGYWSGQYSDENMGPSVPSGTFIQDFQNTHHQISQPAVPSSCCPYVCNGLAVPCSMMPAYTLGGGNNANDTACTMGAGKMPSPEDDKIVKLAMTAAEKAISSVKFDTSSTSNIHEDSCKEGKMTQSITPETDLTVVLNAWYSAGFHTGKYLVEQSIAKSRNE